MAMELAVLETGKTLEVQVSGKLAKEDYARFLPEVECLVKQHGKINILFEMRDFHGWKAGGVWEDIKFGAKHFAHIDRLAMVGDKCWEKAMAVFGRPFTTAKIRYFEHDQIDEARRWLNSE